MFVCFFISFDPKSLQDIISTLDKQDTQKFTISSILYYTFVEDI